MGTLAAALTACGGGGGGGGGTVTPAPQAARVAISSGNAREAGAEGVNAMATGLDSTAGTVGGVEIQTTGTPGAAQLLADHLRRALALQPAALVSGVETSQDVACDSGHYTFTLTQAVSGTLQPGDAFSMAFTNCVLDGITTNGAMRYTVRAFSGGGSAFNMSAAASFESLIALKAGTGARINGTVDATMAQSDSTHYSITISGSSLSVDRYKGGSIAATRTMTSFTQTQTQNGTLTATSTTGTVSGNFPKLGNNVSFDVQTSAAFQVAGGDVYPSAGAGKIIGKDGSSVTLTVLNGTDVRLDWDANGDGTSDGSATLTWTELVGFLG